MRRVLFSFTLVPIFYLLLCSKGFSQPNENILLQNKVLLKNLCRFSSVSNIGSDLEVEYIKFKTEKTENAINLGYGVAFKAFGNIIVPADTAFRYDVHIKNKFIIFVRGVKSTYRNLQNVYSNFKYGMYNNNGQLILDFKYDFIGNTFVPLPDSIIIVEKGSTFQIFNTSTGRLENKIYSTNHCMHDGYSYHEGGASICKEQVYKQLHLEGFKPLIKLREPSNDIVHVHKDSSSAYLETKEKKCISRKYHFIEPLNLSTRKLHFVAAKTINPHTYVLLDETGTELSVIDSYLPNHNETYVELKRSSQFYFIESKKTVEIPEGYQCFCDCYTSQGFLGFKNLKTKKKLFIDKFGNALHENEI